MKRGPKPRGKVKIEWSSKFAYAIGLLVADGCVQKDGRHIDLTSVDKEQTELFKACLGIPTPVSTKRSGVGNLAFCIQFSDVLFHRYLVSIGITPAKSKTIKGIDIPQAYFADFFRGYFDGDGSSYSYYDPAYPKSYRFYLSFTSASEDFIMWLRAQVELRIGVVGYIGRNKNNSYPQLKYSKHAAIRVCDFMYYAKGLPSLRRKRLKIEQSMRIIGLTPRW
ncbi:MAG: LAGLIDADG family homing endonuclease [Minisyncoccota bacterium]